jgi:hypothetical protein
MPICADEVPLEVLFILKPAATSQPAIKPSRTRSTNPRTYGGRLTKAGARQAKKATSVATLSRARIFRWPERPNDSGTCAIARERRTAAMGKARNATIAAPPWIMPEREGGWFQLPIGSGGNIPPMTAPKPQRPRRLAPVRA